MAIEVPQKKGYKHTSLGWIPEGWEEVKIEDVANLNPVRTPQEDNPAISFLGMTDVSEEGKVINNHIRKYDSVQSGFTYFEDEDILVAKITPCFENGKGALVRGLKNGIGFGSTEFHVIRTTNRIIPDYLFYHTRLYNFRGRGEQNMTGSAGQKRVPSDYIKAYKIPLPPLPEQRRIAALLSTWDEAITKTQRLIEQLKQRNKGLMQQLLTGKKRLKGFNGEWNASKLGQIGIIFKGAGISKSEVKDVGFPAIRYGELYTKHNNLIKRITTFIDKDSAKSSKEIRKGDILFAGSGETQEEIGKCATYIFDNSAYAGGDIIVFRPKEEDSIFLGYYLNSPQILIQKSSLAKGHSVVHIYPKDISNLLVIVPNKQEQTAIVTVLEKATEEVEIYEQRLTALKEQKRGLMQVLLTGKKRLKI